MRELDCVIMLEGVGIDVDVIDGVDVDTGVDEGDDVGVATYIGARAA